MIIIMYVLYFLYQHKYIIHSTDELGTGNYRFIELGISVVLVAIGLRFIFYTALSMSKRNKLSN